MRQAQLHATKPDWQHVKPNKTEKKNTMNNTHRKSYLAQIPGCQNILIEFHTISFFLCGYAEMVMMTRRDVITRTAKARAHCERLLINPTNKFRRRISRTYTVPDVSVRAQIALTAKRRDVSLARPCFTAPAEH